MSILVNKSTRLMVQGITGKEGSFHTSACLEYGTNIVAGVTPGKGGMDFEGVPVFNTVSEAVAATKPNVSMIFVQTGFAGDAIMESAEAGIPLVGFIAGITAPPGRRMGHAGAIISGGKGTASEKMAAMDKAGIKVVRNPALIGQTVAESL